MRTNLLRGQLSNEAEQQYLMLFNEHKRAGFDHFFRLFHPHILAFTRSLLDNDPEHEEIADDTLLKLLDKKQKFDSVANMKSFLFTVAHHKCIDSLRKRKKDRKDLADYISAGTIEDSPEAQAVYASALDRVRENLNKLPEEIRRLLEETIVNGKSNKQFGKENQMPERNVAVTKSRKLRWIKCQMGKPGKK